jgi:hypothetical protein
MACFIPWVFLDDQGNAWALGVTSQGALTFTAVTPPPTNAIRSAPLKDISTGSTVAIFVTWTPAGPFLDTEPVSVPPIANKIQMSASGATFWLQVSNGRLQGMFVTGPAQDPVVGQLFNYDMVNPPVNPPNLPNAGLPSGAPGGWLPYYTQPGGIGTQTFPAQQDGTPYSETPSDEGLPVSDTGTPYELGMGFNTAACGHWFAVFSISFASVGCVPSALVLCPLCGFVVQIITPASLLYSDPGYEHISS